MRYLLYNRIKVTVYSIVIAMLVLSMYLYNDCSHNWFYFKSSAFYQGWWHYYCASLSSLLLIIGGSSSLIFFYFLLCVVYQQFVLNKSGIDYCQLIGLSIYFLLSATLQRMYSLAFFEHRSYGGLIGEYGYYMLLMLKDPIIMQGMLTILFVMGCLLAAPRLFVVLVVCLQFIVKVTLKRVNTRLWINLFKKSQNITIVNLSQNREISEEIIEIQEELYTQQFVEPIKASCEFNTTYNIPIKNIFTQRKESHNNLEQMQDLEHRAQRLEHKLQRFGIEGKVSAITPGPVITFFEYTPNIDAKISRIIALEDDLALALEALSVRIIAPVPGTAVVGFEVANKVRNAVLFSEVICSKEFKNATCSLALALGHDVKGNPVIVDLALMPHLLIAGTTGSGKSGVLNAILMSILCKQSHKSTRLILIDPKRLEFSVYAHIPHLLFPIVTEVKKIAEVLKWVLKEMYDRYATMEKVGVRNVIEYNQYAQNNKIEEFYSIVVMIDELADVMLSVGKEVEELIVRIAQMARAASIHLVIATQRPSVDVITGLIKGNFPSRIACRVASKVDSRTILDLNGAQKLLGKGDMLLLSSSEGLKRVHGAYVCTKEISDLIDHLKCYGPPCYVSIDQLQEKHVMSEEHQDELYDQILIFVESCSYISISLLQRRFRIGYNRSARIVEKLEAQGIIKYDASGKLKRVMSA